MPRMTSPPEQHRPLVDLSQIQHPVMKALYPLVGGVLRKALKIDEVNQLEADVAQFGTPASFFRTTLDLLGCRYEVSEQDRQRIPAKGPVVVVSNHPLGGLDGIVLGDLLQQRRSDSKLMANYLLKRVTHADHHMIFVDPFAKDAPTTANIAPLRQSLKHLKAGGLLGVFPGNQVSHYQRTTQAVTDPDWVPHIAALIRRSGATAVPVFIDAKNSWLFERIGLLHPLLRTLLLTREFMQRGLSRQPIPVHIGNPISAPRLKRFDSDLEMIQFLRMSSYMLKNRPPAPPSKARHRPLASTPSPAPPSFKPLATAVAKDLLEADLSQLPAECLLLSQGDFDVYIGRYQELPHVMQEIGRGREESFRSVGGGTGEPLDLAPADEYYRHLFVWSRKDRAIIGAYRLGLADEILAEHGPDGLVSSGLFEFKPAFIQRLNPGLELGRSYVLPEYQRSYSSLLLLWGGILAFIVRHPQYRIIFGSVGVSQGDEYCPASRTLIVDYMRREHGHPELALELESRSPFESTPLGPILKQDLSRMVKDVDDVSALVSGLEPDGKGVPILIKHYIRMNAKLIEFGVWKDHSNAVVAFLMTDLVTADPKFLRRYMGEEGYHRFMAYHGLSSETHGLVVA
jgi:putative hemolysin